MSVISDALLSRHSPLIVLTLLGSQVYAPDANTSELSGVATLTSEYIYRGLAMSDGDPAAQLSLNQLRRMLLRFIRPYRLAQLYKL